MNGQELISIYENVAVITDRMLAAARIGDWDQLVELELLCASQVEALRSEETRVRLTGPNRQRKIALIKKVLEDDRQIRSLTEPWMQRLETMFGMAGAERKPSQTRNTNPTG